MRNFLLLLGVFVGLLLSVSGEVSAAKIPESGEIGEIMYYFAGNNEMGGDEYRIEQAGKQEDSVWDYIVELFDVFPLFSGMILFLGGLFFLGISSLFFWLMSRRYWPKGCSTEAALKVLYDRSSGKVVTFVVLGIFIITWPAMIFFVLWYFLYQRWKIKHQSRICPVCHEAGLVREQNEDVSYYFSEKQKVESRLHSVGHVLYRCQCCNHKFIYTYGLRSPHRECPKCHGITQKRISEWNIVKPATSSLVGECEAEYQCQYCGEKSIWDNLIPRGGFRKGLDVDKYTEWLADISTLTEIQR